MNKKKNTENTLGLKIDAAKVNLIRYFMAEKGLDSEQFDKEFNEQINRLVDKMYNKYVPKDVRKIDSAPEFTITSNTNVTKQTEIKEGEDNVGNNEKSNSEAL